MPKTVKVAISIPDELLERIDREAQRRGISRSDVILNAARHELDRPGSAQIDAAIERGRAALAGAGRLESAVLIHADREAHDTRDRRR